MLRSGALPGVHALLWAEEGVRERSGSLGDWGDRMITIAVGIYPRVRSRQDVQVRK